MRFLKFSLLLFSLFFVYGCVVQSTQLSKVLTILKGDQYDLTDNSWLLKYETYQAYVYAVAFQEGILFANSAGDSIFFDGWSLRKINLQGKGVANLSIDDSTTVRVFRENGRKVGSHLCDSWERTLRNGMTRYYQTCKGSRSYLNRILVDENGDILLIRQIIDQKYTPLTISKVN